MAGVGAPEAERGRTWARGCRLEKRSAGGSTSGRGRGWLVCRCYGRKPHPERSGDAFGPSTGWYASLGGTGGSAAGLGCRLSPKDSCCSSSHPGVSTSRTCVQCSRSGRTYPSLGSCWNSSAQVGDCGLDYRDPCTSGSDGGCGASRVYKGRTCGMAFAVGAARW